MFRDRPFFEAREVTALFGESAAQTQARLSRWVAQKELDQLRRAKYLLARDDWRRSPSVYYLSNYILRPSYVSLHSALEFHGLVPEAVAPVFLRPADSKAFRKDLLIQLLGRVRQSWRRAENPTLSASCGSRCRP